MIFTWECEENGVGVVKEKLPHHYRLTQKITSKKWIYIYIYIYKCNKVKGRGVEQEIKNTFDTLNVDHNRNDNLYYQE